MQIIINIDEKIFHRLKKLFTVRRIVWAIALCAASTSVLIHAATKPHTFLPGAIISSSDVNENFDAAFDAINTLIPAGTVMAYAGSTVPAGYLVCNGSAVSRTTYADLFAAIGTMYGSGDGSTTFNLPDYRGMFLRGHHFGKSSGTTDPDYATRQMGAAQSDLIKSHQHLLPYSNGATAPSGTHATPPWQGIDSTQHSTVAFGGTETRPVNVSVAYIIKH
ncbi:MAG TPA: phage tail protein [Spirochaetota bacterium]|nr:phage tail protein [Spirochaetota bacterium]